MTEDDLLVGIGADTSAFDAALDEALAHYNKFTRKLTQPKANSLGLNIAPTVKELIKAEKKVDKFRKDMQKRVRLELKVDVKDKEAIKQLERLTEVAIKNQAKVDAANRASLEKQKQDALEGQQKISNAIFKRKQDEYLHAKALEDKSIRQALENQKILEQAATRAALREQKRLAAIHRQLEESKTRAALKAQKEREQYELRRANILYKRELANAERLSRKQKKIAADLADYKERRSMLLYKRELANIRRRERKAQQAAKQASGGTDTYDRNMLSVKHAVKATALYGAMALAIGALRDAYTAVATEIVAFDQAIYDNMAVLTKSREEATQLAIVSRDLAKAYGTSSAEIQEAMLTIGRAGVDSTKQLISATKVLTQLAMITGDSMTDGAAGLSTMLSVYPELKGNIDGLGESMARVANATRLGIKDFTTISNYALTTAASVGLSSDSYLALAGAMSKVGLNASTIGTSIRRLKKFTDSSATSMQTFFRAIGIGQKEFAEGLKTDSNKALVEFSRRLANVPADRLQKALAGLNIQEKATADTLRQIGKNDYMVLMISQIGGLNGELKSLDEQAKIMSTGMTRVFTRIGEAISQTFNERAVSAFNSLLGVDANTSINAVIASVDKFAASMIEFGKVFLAAIALMTSFKVLVWAVTGAMTAYRDILKFVKATTVATTRVTMTLSLALKSVNVVIGIAALAYWAFSDSAEAADNSQLNLGKTTAKTAAEMSKLSKAQLAVQNIDISKKLKENAKLLDKARKDMELQASLPIGNVQSVQGVAVSSTPRKKASSAAYYEQLKKENEALKEQAKLIQSVLDYKSGDALGKENALDWAPSAEALSAIDEMYSIAQLTRGETNAMITDYGKLNAKLSAANVILKETADLKASGKSPFNEEDIVKANLKVAQEELRIYQFKAKLQKDITAAKTAEVQAYNQLLIASGKLSVYDGKIASGKLAQAAAQERITKAAKLYNTLASKSNGTEQDNTNLKIAQLDLQKALTEQVKLMADELANITAETNAQINLYVANEKSARDTANAYANLDTAIASASLKYQQLNTTLTGTAAAVKEQALALADLHRVLDSKVGALGTAGVALDATTSNEGASKEDIKAKADAYREAELAVVNAYANIIAQEAALEEVRRADQEANINYLNRMEALKARDAIAQAAPSTVAKEDKGVATAKANVEKATVDLKGASELLALNAENRDYIIAQYEATVKLHEAQKKLVQAERDKADAAKKAKATKDRNEGRLELSIMQERVNLENNINAMEQARSGFLFTEAEINAQNLEIATEQVGLQLELAAAAEAKAAAAPKDLRVQLKMLQIQNKLMKDEKKMFKLRNKELKKFAKGMKAAGGNLADGILAGDFKNLFKNLTKDMIDVFFAPIKDEFSTLFGNTMKTLFTSFYEDTGEAAVASSVKATTAKETEGAANAAASVAGAGQGDPYTAAARVLIMIALMASVGFVMGGGSGGGGGLSGAALDSAAGNDYKTSESTKNVLEMINRTNTKNLTYSRGIFENTAALVEQTGKAAVKLSTDGFNYNAANTSNKGFAGFNKSSTKSLGAGIILDGTTYAQLQAGSIRGRSYDVTETTSSSWWGMSESTSTSTSYSALSGEFRDALGSAYSFGIKAIESSATALGMDSFDSIMEGWKTSAQKVNVKGKSSEEIAKILESVISADLDRITAQLMPSIKNYAKAGEEAYETLARLAYDVENVDVMLQDATGDGFTKLGESAIQISETFLNAAGGIENALSMTEGYIDNFYTDQEKQEKRIRDITRTNAVLYDTEAEFKAAQAAGELKFKTRQELKDYMEETAELMKVEGVEKTVTRTRQVEGVVGKEYYDSYWAAWGNQDRVNSGELGGTLKVDSKGVYRDVIGLVNQEYTANIVDTSIAEKAALDRAYILEHQDDYNAIFEYNEEELQRLKDEEKEALEKEIAAKQEYLDSLKGLLDEIDSLYLGANSYLNSQEKQQYLQSQADRAYSLGDEQAYLDDMEKKLQYDKKLSTTKEDYALTFEEYIADLKHAGPEKSLDDVVLTLDELIEQTKDVESAIYQTSYQAAIV